MHTSASGIIGLEEYRSGHNEAVLKTVWVQAHGGSNPSSSAIFLLSVSHWIVLARCIRVVLKYASARAFVVAIKFNYVI